MVSIPPRGGGGRQLTTVPPGVGGNRRPWGMDMGGGKVHHQFCGSQLVLATLALGIQDFTLLVVHFHHHDTRRLQQWEHV